MSFDTLGLATELLRAVAAQGYTEPTPIQRQAIPAILAGRDIMAGAQTGTGKTAAFTLPMLHLMSQSPSAGGRSATGSQRPRALVLTPTRELAAQVGASIRTYGQYLPLRAIEIFGGVGMQPQVQALRRGMDIVVATPGRLLDHAGQQTVDLGGIEFLVLDEADRMLDMGFIHDIKRVLKLLPARRQNLLFSATYSSDIEQLARGLLHDPQRIEVARRNTAAELVTQIVHPVAGGRKRELLSHLIRNGDWQQVLVFTRTKHGANRLAQQLERDGIGAAAIHGNKSQGARTRALAEFKAGTVRVLVATDIAARGLDIDRLPHVVNFELPNVPEDYVHRIGRTGRAGSEGAAVSLVGAEERRLLADIERVLGRPIERALVPGFEDLNAVGPDPVDEPRRGRPAPRSGPRSATGSAPGSSPGGARAHHPRPRSNEGRGPRLGTRPGGDSRSHGRGNGNGTTRRSPAG